MDLSMQSINIDKFWIITFLIIWSILSIFPKTAKFLIETGNKFRGVKTKISKDTLTYYRFFGFTSALLVLFLVFSDDLVDTLTQAKFERFWVFITSFNLDKNVFFIFAIFLTFMGIPLFSKSIVRQVINSLNIIEGSETKITGATYFYWRLIGILLLSLALVVLVAGKYIFKMY